LNPARTDHPIIAEPTANFDLGADVVKTFLFSRTGAVILVFALMLCSLSVPTSALESTPAAEASPAATPEAPVTPQFGIYPKETGPRTFFDVVQEAGTAHDYTVVLVNAGGEEQGDFVGRTFVVDGRAKVNGGLDTGGPDEEKTGATTWFDYPNDIVTLEPGKGIERTFSVTVPEDTPPGQYVVAMCFETAEPIAIEGIANLKQNLRQTIAFYLTVPGEVRPEFSVEQPRLLNDPTWSGIEAVLVNSGNVLVRPEGRITISNPDGSPLASTEIGFGAFYAGQSGLIQIGLGNLLPNGDYLVTIELRDPATGATALIEDQPVTVTTSEQVAADAAPPVEIISATGEIVPDLANPQFLDLDVVIANNGEPISDAEVSLQVLRDGELIENYVVVSPLSLTTGETPVSSRYIPIDGWQSGSWSFTVSVQTLDRATGVAQIVSTMSLGDPIVLP
jgi:hypothetical protein